MFKASIDHSTHTCATIVSDSKASTAHSCCDGENSALSLPATPTRKNINQQGGLVSSRIHPHTCFERAAILQRLPTVSTCHSPNVWRRHGRPAGRNFEGRRPHAKALSSKKHAHFIRKSYTMNPQSTDTRVVSRDSCEDRSSEAACTDQLLGRHACTQCHDVMTVTTSHSNPRRALDGGRRRHLSVHRLRNSDYNECERQVVDGERGGGEGGNQRIERRGRQETREKVEKVFQLFGFDYSLVGVGRSRRYCNTGPTRGEVGASSCIFSQFQKSV